MPPTALRAMPRTAFRALLQDSEFTVQRTNQVKGFDQAWVDNEKYCPGQLIYDITNNGKDTVNPKIEATWRVILPEGISLANPYSWGYTTTSDVGQTLSFDMTKIGFYMSPGATAHSAFALTLRCLVPEGPIDWSTKIKNVNHISSFLMLSDLTICSDEQYESVAPDAISDRECAGKDDGIPAPWGVVLDSVENILYVSDGTGEIKKVDKASGNVLSTVATGLNYPTGLAIDTSGNLYVCDTRNHRIMKVAINGDVSVVAGSGTKGYAGDGGNATAAALNFPYDVIITQSGDLYIADTFNHAIRKVDSATGFISTVAGGKGYGYSGDGQLATTARLNYPTSLASDAFCNIFIADINNNAIRKVDTAGYIYTIAGGNGGGYEGDGLAANSAAVKLEYPYGIAVDASGNLYISDTTNQAIRMVDQASGIIETIAGGNGQGYSGDQGISLAAQLSNPIHLAIDTDGSIYLADYSNNAVRKLNRSN
eukprot:gene8627-34072_t